MNNQIQSIGNQLENYMQSGAPSSGKLQEIIQNISQGKK